MKNIKLQEVSNLRKDELKSIIGGVITYEHCVCSIKVKDIYGHIEDLPMTSVEQAQVAQSSSVESCASICASICHNKSNCYSYEATYDASGSK